MRFHAVFDAGGYIQSCHGDGVDAPVPDGAVEITAEQHALIFEAPQYRRYVDGAVIALPIPSLTEPPPPDISDRQFGEGLWRDGLIAYADYLAFVGPGTVPPPLQAIIDGLPDDDTGRPTPRKVAQGLVTGAQAYRIADPLVDVVRQALGWSVAHLHARWRAWSAL